MIAVHSGLAMIGIGFFHPLISFITQGREYITSQEAVWIGRLFSAFHLPVTLESFLVIFCCTLILMGLSNYLVDRLGLAIYNPIMHDIRSAGFDNLSNAELHYFSKIKSGIVVNQLLEDVEYLGQTLNYMLRLLTDGVILVIYFALMFWLSPALALLALCLGGIRYGISTFFVRRSRKYGNEHADILVRFKSYLIGFFQGIALIKSYGTVPKERDRFREIIATKYRNERDIIDNANIQKFSEVVFGTIFLCAVVYLSIKVFSISTASVLTFLFIVSRMIPLISVINDSRVRMAEYAASVKYLPELFEADIQERHTGSKPFKRLTRCLAFEDVNFSYDGTTCVLKNINIVMPAGSTTALVGESGAGKSTLINLLLGLYRPDSGIIRVDDLDLQEVKRSDWQASVSVVSQHTFVFDDSIRSNIEYAVGTVPDDRFWHAVRMAGAYSFIQGLPQKENTRVGERGINLSGGQLQRIAIARAFLRQSDLLILDEATSALDSVTEKQIKDAILKLTRNKTVIVVAHRISTIRDADQIVVLEAGRVVEVGSHKSLIENHDLYRKYHLLQV